MIVKNDMKKVTLLIPVYNEEAMLPTLYQRLIELVNRNAVYEWEILFVNDGSSDTTLECLRRLRQQDKRVNYVNLSRNFGKEVAMLAGFDYATGDCCVVMDADLQDPPELVDQMLEYWEEGYDDIYAKRRTRGEESWLRRQFSAAARTAFWSRGVKARSACCTRLPSWPSTFSGMSSGFWLQK